MNKIFPLVVLIPMVLTACAGLSSLPIPTTTSTSLPPTSSPSPLPSSTPTSTPVVPTATSTPPYPVEGYGPGGFPADVNPLTGLQVSDPTLLDRRPIIVKVSNLPRSVRPQWGLSLADIVFEYYTEEGTTRFAAIFYSRDAALVGPIRSGRFFDANLVRGYKAIFVFGGAYVEEMNLFNKSDFSKRMITQLTQNNPLTRYDPNGYDHLMGNTADITTFAISRGMDNGRQNLDGMTFKLDAPSGGVPLPQIIVRHSGSIYNRWDYDPSSGKYTRYSDTVDDFEINHEQYELLTDRLNGQPITADNLVVVYAPHNIYFIDSKGFKIYDIPFTGSGEGYAFRNGQAYTVKWQRGNSDVVSLTFADGTPFPFKPGNTWFEVVGTRSTLQKNGQVWRFQHIMP